MMLHLKDQLNYATILLQEFNPNYKKKLNINSYALQEECYQRYTILYPSTALSENSEIRPG